MAHRSTGACYVTRIFLRYQGFLNKDLQVALELESHKDVHAVRDFLRSKGFHVYWTNTPSLSGNEPSELSTLYARRELCTELSPDEGGYLMVDNVSENETDEESKKATVVAEAGVSF
eukprot:gb/GECG01002199.1/.p1 GENE.gb/GECG01002199.1/~~gb/GECG01002199.1/.p1  ORF type:complete len:117 (+),score=11.91 gb/GECG01002199.1/:1-351(+)